MRTVVIDANVFRAFAYEVVAGRTDAERTASPLPLFESLGSQCVAFLDEGGQVQSEWATLANFAAEWFGTWLAEAFAEGKMYEVEASTDPQLPRRYRNLGFPTTKDIWYIKTAHGLVTLCRRSRPLLVAEDVDFYDPSKKQAANKADIFRAGRGPVCKQLKADGIDLRCIEAIGEELGLVV
jgi:hypothetical protein